MTVAAMADLIVVGGGIVGASIAWQAHRQGLSVCVVDTALGAPSATPSSAGVLWPLEPLDFDSPFRAWVDQALDLYPEFLRSLTANPATDCGYHRHGLLRLDAQPQDLEPGERWAQQCWPGQSEPIAGAWVAAAARVDPPRLLACLQRLLLAGGVPWIHERVLRVSPSAQVHTDNGVLAAGRVVLATGAWPLAGHTLPELQPVAGQMLRLRPVRPYQGPMLRHGEAYLVPVAGGDVLLGATLEQRGFATQVTAEALAWLQAQQETLAGIIGPAETAWQWLGLRPCYAQGVRPFIGRTAVAERVAWATGAYRLGMTIAPAVAQQVALWAAGNTEAIPLIEA